MVSLTIKREHFDLMLNDVSTRAPEEACGLVAGLENCTIEVAPIENVLRSDNQYRMSPDQQVEALLSFEEKGWALLAIYHSHPCGPGTPSQTDIQEAAYPEAVHLIWHQTEDDWVCRAFTIREASVKEIAYDLE